MSGAQEFTVKIPNRNEKKNYYVMKFNSSLGVDVAKWNQVRMVRENNQKVKTGQEEEQPEFGAGSEFGKKQKEEARRKKFGMISKKYDPDAQPWLMRVGSKKEGKHFKGIREGGVSNNTTYYVFTHAQDGSFEVHPVKEWYNFTPRATYKTLNAEEAEERFEQRNKILNKWAVMVNKKARGPEGEDGAGGDDDDDEGGGAGKAGKKSKANKSFKVSDMDEWVDDEDGLDSDEDEEDEDGESKKSGKKGKGKDKDDQGKGGKDARKKKKKSKYDVENEAFEDSDDGDDEHREVDYITDESSEGEEEMQEAVELKGVDQDDGGLRKMLDSESSSEDSDEEEKKDDDKKDKDKDDDDKEKDDKKGKKGKGKKADKKGSGSAPGSRSTSPTPGDGKEEKSGGPDAGAASAKKEKADKRKALINDILDPNEGPESKRPRTSEASGSAEAMFEEDVRRYLARKPMTTTEILKKINTRKTGIPKEELMPLLVSALKRINPHKQKVKGIMYLSLKSN